MNLFRAMIMSLLAMTVSLVSFETSQAQTDVALGAKAGTNFSNLRGEDADDTERKVGFTGGMFLSISPRPFLTVQPELLFTQRGATNTNETLNIKQELRANYIDIPVLFKLRLPIDDVFFPHVYIGPQFSTHLNNTYSVEQLDTNIEIDSEVDVNEFDFGGVFGAGMDIQSNHLLITVDFRYGLGALNINENDDGIEIKHSDLMFFAGVGYLF